MKIVLNPQNIVEWLAKRTGLAPIPLADTHIFSFVSRGIYDAVHFGIFDALEGGALDASQIAGACGLDPSASFNLLGMLAAQGYLGVKGDRFSLTRISRTWLLKDGPRSIRDQLLFMRAIWSWLEEMQEFLVTGKGMEFHPRLSPEHWVLYQAGMRSLARASAGEVARKTPLPRKPILMLDIGGSHGLYSVAICRRHAGLRSRILDLPQAVEIGRDQIRGTEEETFVEYVAGDALNFEYGENKYDLVFISSLMHHFTGQQNKILMNQLAAALKPGGYLVIQEFIRPPIRTGADIIGSTLALFFELSSNGRTWSLSELSSWQKAAGLVPRKTNRLITMPGFAQIIAQKSS